MVNLDVHDNKTEGDLEFTKHGRYNNVTDEVIVVGFKIYNETTNEWVIANQVNGDGKANYYEATRETTTDFEKATEFRTGGTDNKVYVKCLNKDSTYKLVETYSENPYYNDPIDIDSATATTGKADAGTVEINGVPFEVVSSVTVLNTNTNAVRIIDNRTSGDLTLYKRDSINEDVNLEAGFKLYSKKDNAWVTRNSDGKFEYTAKTANDATIFRTNSDGIIKLECIRNATYEVYEVEMPVGYDMSKQDGYDDNNKWVYIGTITITTENNTITYTMNNKKVVSIEGKVFVDNPESKANNYNNLYDDGERLLDNIEVHLIDKTKDNKIIATRYTKDGGKYRFNNLDVSNDKGDNYIYYWYLKNYYVEFIYDNQTYITTVPFIDDNIDDNQLENGSRAIEYEFSNEELDDKNLTGTSGALPGKATTYQGATTDSEGLAKYYNNTSYYVEHINLGLKVKLEPKFTVTQNIAYVRAEINDYTYTYNYGGTSKKSEMIYAPTVRFQSKGDVTAFTRKIYPSDIVYNGEHGNLFNVNVVYRIDIQNDTAFDIKDLYTEEKMYIDRLVDSYDTERYILNDSNWAQSGDGEAIYTGSDFSDGTKVADGIEGIMSEQSNESDQNNKTVYIQFKVKPEALYKLLQQPTAENFEELGLEKSPTTATVTTYHTYWVDQNYDWYDNISDKKLHKSKNYEKSAEAPYLYLILGDETGGGSRSLSGNVFEDGKVDELNGESRENERIGNGVYDENENTVENVKVELLQKDSSNPNNYVLANLYPISVSNGGEIPKAITWTSDKGKYEFTDMIPGDYYVRYTYGDGTQKICKAGNENEKLRDVSSNVYKSTIVTSENALDALEHSNDDNKRFWYINQGEDNKYSTAVDAIDSIIPITDASDEVYARKQLTQGGTTTNNIGADTARIGIPVEYSEASANGQSEGYDGTFTETRTEETTNKDGEVIVKEVTVTVANDNAKNRANYSNMNFGIIEMPKTKLTIDKKIVYAKITLSNGQVIVEWDPSNNMKKDVKYLKDMNGDGTNVVVELDNQYIYGSELEIKYALTVKNESELYYTTDEYYISGKKGTPSEEGTVKIDRVYDYLDPRVEYKSIDETDLTVTKVKVDDLTNDSEEKKFVEYAETVIYNECGARVIDYDEILEINNFGTLNTTKGDNVDTSTKTATITATRTLSTEEEDLDVINMAQITGISIPTILIPPIPPDTPTDDPNVPGNPSLDPRTTPVILGIIPSTGEDRSNYTYIYVIAGMVILVAGVVIIKKKVL